MSSHSRSKHQHTSKKTTKRTRHQTKQAPSTFSYRPNPFAPAELDAMLGYGTSRSFPLFMEGIVSMIKKAFSHTKHP